jgi:hypothetical protein
MSLIAARWLATGLIATLTMDVGAALSRRTGLSAGVPPQLLGRWFARLARGAFADGSVLQAPPVRGELPLALIGHYLIGVTLTLGFSQLVAALPARTPAEQLRLSLAFGVATTLLPWLLMYPSMGFGLFGRRGPAELLLLRTSLLNHVFFAVGLLLASRWLGLFPVSARTA